MIATLSGRVQEIDTDSLVLETGGVGLQVYVPVQFKEKLHPGEKVFLYTYLNVREDALTLYGFETKDEREIYHLLLAVNGVGPRLELAVLSALSPEEIRLAVIQEQADTFQRVPGIGKKTSLKIILQLQDQIPVEFDIEKISPYTESDAEVIAALTALGYSVVEAQAALQSIPSEAPPDVEGRLRLALQYFQ